MLQVSFVHGLPSSQLAAGPPTQVPPLHVSLVVHALPSLHALVLFVCTQPVDVLQVSVVQGLVSSQLGGGPPTQEPAAHVSLVVHALLSLQAAVLLVWTQPDAGLQESSVQGFESSQLIVVPAQTPPVHTSPDVQALPSLQAAVLLV